MKPNERREVVRKKICELAGVRGVRYLKPKHFKVPVLELIRKEYRDILILCGEMFRLADSSHEAVILNPENPRWQECELHTLTKEDFTIIRRTCTADGYPIGISKECIIVPPKLETIKPHTASQLSVA